MIHSSFLFSEMRMNGRVEWKAREQEMHCGVQLYLVAGWGKVKIIST